MQKRTVMAAMGLAFYVTGLCALAARSQGQGESIRWFGDFEQAKSVARETGKPLFIVFR